MSSLPSIGIRCHSGASGPQSVELAVLAETLGFSSVWFAENPYERGILPILGACAAKTGRIQLGIGVFNPYNRHPALMAMEAAALDELSGGRASLGIGSGVPQWTNKIVPHEKPIAAVRDAVTIAKQLLRGETVSYEGKMFSAREVGLGLDLVRNSVPVYVAAMAEQALRVTGECGDGLIIGNMCPPAFTGSALNQMQAGAERASRDLPTRIVKYVPCVVHENGDIARALVKRSVARTLAAYLVAYEAAPAVRASICEGNGIAPEEFSDSLAKIQEGMDPALALSDAFVDAYAVAGTPDECLRQCAMLGESGVTEVVLSCVGEDVEKQMRLLASQRPAQDRRAH